MADPALQALLDPDATGLGIRITDRIDDLLGTTSSYYCIGNVYGKGKSLFVNVPTGNTDAQKNTAIRAAFGVA